jgi:CHASE2 domain-containing sensor protein
MKKIAIQSALTTVFVFFMLWFVSVLTDLKMFTAFDPISQALADFELTDYAFSSLRPDPPVEERIVVVNIGNLSRGEVGQQINILAKYKPKVIGLDSYFNCEGGFRDSVNCPQLLDTLGNLILSNAIQEAGNVVLVSKLLQKTATAKSELIDLYDSVEYSDPLFNPYARNGYANLVTGAVYQEDVKLCRSFIPKYKVNGEEQHAFAVEICKVYDSLKTAQFLARGNEEEIINYRGNIEIQDIKLKTLKDKKTTTTEYPIMCFALDVGQVLNEEFEPEMIKDNIVILGYLGDYIGDPSWTDKYFTPLNNKIGGRANPDMFGVVVHTNIIAMILNGDYVNQLSEFQKILIAILTCFFTVALFIWIDSKIPAWFDGLSVIIQIIQILIFSSLIVYVYADSSFKLDLSLTIGISALVGPCYDVFKSIMAAWEQRQEKRRARLATAVNEPPEEAAAL